MAIRHDSKRNIQLTKVYYYDRDNRHRNMEIFTLTTQAKINNDRIIKKNVFGHKWVLKINEVNSVKKSTAVKLVVYVLVIFSLIIAMVFGILFFLDAKYFRIFYQNNVPKIKNNNEKTKENTTIVPIFSDTTITRTDTEVTETIPTHSSTSVTKLLNESHVNQSDFIKSPIESVCKTCKNGEVCMNTSHSPVCMKALNENDPTGCGGLCRIGEEYCRVLEQKVRLFQCMPDMNRLRCSDDQHNCGNMCIPKTHVCDGYFHCADKSDELGCECNLETHFQCGNSTSCLDKSKLCDGSVDCWDLSDERECYNKDCSENEYPCRKGICISKENICDGKFDCQEKDDETIGCLKKFLQSHD